MSRPSALPDDERAVTPAVGKALEVGVVVLFVGLTTAALYGGVVPTYRDAVGDEVADRAVAAAAERMENAVPPAARQVRVVHRVPLPDTIRGERYRVVATNRSLVLSHPDPAVGARARLALPERVVSVGGAWASDEETVVRVTGNRSGQWVRLTTRGAVAGGGA